MCGGNVYGHYGGGARVGGKCYVDADCDGGCVEVVGG